MGHREGDQGIPRQVRGITWPKILIGKYEGTIYPEGDGFTGAVSLGFGLDGRRRSFERKGKTKAEVNSPKPSTILRRG
jgi:hypothetical protein